MISIGELAARSGVSVRALRYYEQQDLLPARARNGRGHRLYPESAVERVGLIQQLYAAGLSSHSILAICPLTESGHQPAGPTGQCLALLHEERERLDRQVQELTSARARLDAVISNATQAQAS